jgi:hypothetical protein
MRASKRFFASAFCSARAPAASIARASAFVFAVSIASASAFVVAASIACASEATTWDAYARARPVAAKSIGHTSYVLKVRFEGGLVAAFKPRSTLPLGRVRYRAEVAAFRLARALGLSNVPPASGMTLRAPDLAAAFATPEGRREFEAKAVPDPDGTLPGALIPWIDDYEVVPLESGALRAKWQAWLMDPASEPAAPDRTRAASISTLLAFDYLTANWDRWSGGNVAEHAATGELLFVDNDGAFYDPPPAANLASQLERLRHVVRFSRSFVAALRALSDARLREALAGTAEQPLFSDGVIAAALARRDTLLGVIDARMARAGEIATLAFE